ncbi:hypothetical protein [Streptomyces chartreusis]
MSYWVAEYPGSMPVGDVGWTLTPAPVPESVVLSVELYALDPRR